MVIIRLSRGGSKKRPFYHLVATDSRNKRDGRYLERLGYFNPIATGGEIPLFINVERVAYWRGVGAQMSDRVTKLMKDFAKAPTASAKKTEAPAKPAKAAAAPEEVVAETTAEVAVATEETPVATETAVESVPAEDAPSDKAEKTED